MTDNHFQTEKERRDALLALPEIYVLVSDTSGKTVINREYDVTVLIDAICGELAEECVKAGLIQNKVSYLEDAVLPLSERIHDDLIFKLPLETYVRLW